MSQERNAITQRDDQGRHVIRALLTEGMRLRLGTFGFREPFDLLGGQEIKTNLFLAYFREQGVEGTE